MKSSYTLSYVLVLLIFVTLTFSPHTFPQANPTEYVVRVIYFHPNDIEPQEDSVTTLKTMIKDIQTFYADEMERHGYGRKTFRLETDQAGNVVVVRMIRGTYSNAQYNEAIKPPFNKNIDPSLEIEKQLDFSKKLIYLIWVDSYDPDTGSGLVGGSGYGESVRGHVYLGINNFDSGNVSGYSYLWRVAAHELGHAFGLRHDFRSDAYIMSYGGTSRNQLSSCTAKWLDAHKYFNSIRAAINDNTEVQMHSPSLVAAPATIRLQFKITDPDGLHQVQLLKKETDKAKNRGNLRLLDCKSLNSDRSVVEFVTNELTAVPPDKVYLRVMDVHGNFGFHNYFRAWEFEIDYTRLLPPPKTVSTSNRNPELKVDIEIPRLSPAVHIGAAQRPPLYWIDAEAGTLHRLIEDTVENIIPSVRNAASLAVDVPNDKLYWARQTGDSSGTINSANLDGSGVTEVVKSRWSVPMGIALDTANKHLYWTNSSGKIKRASLDGKQGQNVLQNLLSPMDIALAADNVYWTQGNGSVRFVNLQRTKDIHNIATGIGTPLSLVIAGSKLYWTQQTGDSSGTINSANLDGSEVTEVVKSRWSVPMGIALDIENKHLYWTNSSGKIKRANLNGSNEQNVVDGLGVLGKLVFGGAPPTAQTEVQTPKPIAPPTTHRAEDVNQDKKVNKTDLLLVVTALDENPPANPNFDVNADGAVNIADVLLVIEALDDPVAAAAPVLGKTITALDPTRLAMQIDLLRAESDGSMKYEHAIAFFQSLLASIRPTETLLLANYPNPFNPETWIPYQLATDSDVRINIYDARGSVVRVLTLGHQTAGYYTSKSRAAHWDGRNAFGERVASGIYFYQLAGNVSPMRKMLILK